jgi:hypothetical protein
VVADGLSQMSHANQLVVRSIPSELSDEFDKLSLKIIANIEVVEMEVGSTLLQDIRIGQLEGVTPTFYKNKFFVQIGVHIKMYIKLLYL